MKTAADIIEDIQQAIVESGGRFFRQEDIKELAVKDLLKILVPNGISVEIGHKQSSDGACRTCEHADSSYSVEPCRSCHNGSDTHKNYIKKKM